MQNKKVKTRALNADELPDLLTTIEAGQYLRVGSNTIGYYIRSGRLPALKIPGSSVYRIEKADLLTFVKENKSGRKATGNECGTI